MNEPDPAADRLNQQQHADQIAMERRLMDKYNITRRDVRNRAMDGVPPKDVKAAQDARLIVLAQQVQSIITAFNNHTIAGLGFSGKGSGIMWNSDVVLAAIIEQTIATIPILDSAAFVTFNGTVYENNTIFGIVGTPI